MRNWLRRLLLRDPELRRFTRILAGAVGFTVAPFAWWGESWGTYWYFLNLPSSEILKDLWEWLGPVIYIAVATIANWYLVGIALYGAGLAVRSLSATLERVLQRGPSDSGPAPTAPAGT